MDAHPRPPARSLLVPLTFALVISAAACSKEQTPEQQIRALLDEGVKALEARDVSAAAALLSEGYKDTSGRDKQRMKGIAFVLLRQGPLRLSLSNEHIEVEPGGQRAKVSATARALQATGAPETVGDLVPRGRAVSVEIALAREGSAWRVTAIEGDGAHGGMGEE